MRASIVISVVMVLALSMFTANEATAMVLFSDGFENPWSGDYAPGWVNAAYRHGEAPVGKMMEQNHTSHTGTWGLKLYADSTPQSWMWWAAVEVENLPHNALDKQYNPYVSVWYYDETATGRAGQVYAVPDWVNPYIDGSEDWTDVQFGGRFNVTDNYYYVAAGENSPGWQNTGVGRSIGWHNLKFQLLDSDGRIHFYLDGVEVGSSYRDDYTNLGTAIGLYTMFQPPLSDWGCYKPYTLWDDFEVGSAVPIPGAIWLLGSGLLGLVGLRRKFRG
ncbi:MAG: hypothetical protein AB1641_03785 [Thermodesulfobacteriota bacterium]